MNIITLAFLNAESEDFDETLLIPRGRLIYVSKGLQLALYLAVAD